MLEGYAYSYLYHFFSPTVPVRHVLAWSTLFPNTYRPASAFAVVSHRRWLLSHTTPAWHLTNGPTLHHPVTLSPMHAETCTSTYVGSSKNRLDHTYRARIN